MQDCERHAESMASSDVRCFVLDKREWRRAANRLALELNTKYPHADLLFWDATLSPMPGALTALRDCFEGNESPVCVIPLTLYQQDGLYIQHMGYAVDGMGFVRSLYEGFPAESPVTDYSRALKLVSDQLLLVRLADFVRLGGFSESLDDELCAFDFSIRLGAAGPIVLAPKARFLCQDVYASWYACGLWNSQQQRGRIPPGIVRPDYHSHLARDGFVLSADAWLTLTPLADAVPPPVSAWQAYLRSQNPMAYLEYLEAVSFDERERAIAAARAYPYYLPSSFAWYTETAHRLLSYAKAAQCERLQDDVVRWLKESAHFCERFLHPCMRGLWACGVYNASLDFVSSAYDAWIECVEPALHTRTCVEETRSWPTIGVLMPVYNPERRFLAEALDSVFHQRYPHWQLCLADDASSDPGIRDFLKERAGDSRIRLIFRNENGGISRATNSALRLCEAPYACLMDQDDCITPDALEEVARAFVDGPDRRVVYSDEDHCDSFGVRRTPIFKHGCDWNVNGTGHLTTYATDLLRDIGGLAPGFEGAQDYDLSLRVRERTAAFYHIPRILYHWRIHPGSTAGSIQAKPYARLAQEKALAAHATRCSLQGETVRAGRFYRFALLPPANFRVSVVFLGDARPDPLLVKSLAQLESSLCEVFWQPLSAAGTPHLLSAFVRGHFADVPLIALKPRETWQEACTASAEKATGTTILFLSASLTPGPETRVDQLAYATLLPSVVLATGYLWHAGCAWDLGLFPDEKGGLVTPGRGFSRALLEDAFLATTSLPKRVLGGEGPMLRTAVDRRFFLEVGGFSQAMGRYAEADFVLRAEERGRIALTSPWGYWTAAQIREDQESQSFFAVWRAVLKNHPLRNPLLVASPDNGWALHFPTLA